MRSNQMPEPRYDAAVSVHQALLCAMLMSQHTCIGAQAVHATSYLAMQALAEQQAEDLRQHQCRMQHDKQQLAVYWEAQEAARAEAQAIADAQAKDDAIQVGRQLVVYTINL